MVDIKLLSLNKALALIECFPEGKEEDAFQLLLDLETRKIIKNSLNEYNNYALHASHKIFDLYATTGSVPQTTTSIWY